MLTALLLAQSIAGPVLPVAPAPRLATRCPIDRSPDEIVVCARGPDAYRLKPLPGSERGPVLPKAEVRLGNTALAAEVEQATLAGGVQSQRLMIRFKIPLGKKKEDAK